MSNWQDDAMWAPAQPQSVGDPYSHSQYRRKKKSAPMSTNNELANGSGTKRMLISRDNKNDSSIDAYTTREAVVEMERQQTVTELENKEKQKQLSEANAIQKQNDYNQRKSQLFANGNQRTDPNTTSVAAAPPQSKFASKFSKSLKRVQESGSSLLNPSSPHRAPAGGAPSPLHYKILQKTTGETSSLDTAVNLNPAPANPQTMSRGVGISSSGAPPTRPTRPPMGPTKPPVNPSQAAPTILKRPASPDSPPKPETTNRSVTFETDPVTVTIPSPEAISKPDISKRAQRSWLDLDEMTSSEDDDDSGSAETDYSDLGDSPLITSTQSPPDSAVSASKQSPPFGGTRSRDEEVIRSPNTAVSPPQQSKFSAAVSDLHESRGGSPYNASSRQDVRNQPRLRSGRAGLSNSPSYSSGSPTHRSGLYSGGSSGGGGSGSGGKRFRGSPKRLSDKSRRDYDRDYTDRYQSEYRTTYVNEPQHHSGGGGGGGGGDGRAARKKKKKKSKKRSQHHADYSSGGSNKGSLKRGAPQKGGATQYRSKQSQRYRSSADAYDYGSGGGGDGRYVQSNKLSFDTSRSKRARSEPSKGSFLDRNADPSKDKYYDDAPTYKRPNSGGSGGGNSRSAKKSDYWSSKSRGSGSRSGGSSGSRGGGRGSRRETSSYYGDEYSSSKSRKSRNRDTSYRERDGDYGY